MTKTKQAKVPPSLDTRIRIICEFVNPDENGDYTFYPVFPTIGTPDFRIKAKTSKEAREMLVDYIFNELDCQGRIGGQW